MSKLNKHQELSYWYGGMLSHSKVRRNEISTTTKSILQLAATRAKEVRVKQRSHRQDDQMKFLSRLVNENGKKVELQRKFTTSKGKEKEIESESTISNPKLYKVKLVSTYESNADVDMSLTLSQAYMALQELDDSIECIKTSYIDGGINKAGHAMNYLQQCGEDLSEQILLLKFTRTNRASSKSITEQMDDETINIPSQPALSININDSKLLTQEANDTSPSFFSWMRTLVCYSFEAPITLRCSTS